jgi:plasmid replication initiation protein
MGLGLEGVYMSDDGVTLPVVRKSNLLIESICKATTNEKRVVIMGASKVRKDDPVGKTYSFHLSEIKKYSGVQSKRFYKDLAEAIVSIKRRDLWLKQETGRFELTNWFSWIDYDEKTLTLKFRFDQSVHEFLTVLGENFTTYLVSNAISLSKAQYITLFELLKSYQYKGNGKKFYREIEIDYLSERLNLAETGYDRFQDLRRFIIEPAVKAINQCTDIFIYKVDYIKTGRKYTSISFYCEPSDQIRIAVDTQEQEPVPQVEDEQEDDKQIDLVEFIDEKEKELDAIKVELLKHGIITAVAEKLLHDFSIEQIQKNIDYTLEQNAKGKVGDLARYLHDAITNHYAKSWKPKKTEPQKKPSDESKKAVEEKEREEEQLRNKEKQESDRAIAFFEQLDEVTQNVILDVIEKRLTKMEKVRFGIARQGKAAHTERTYAFHFKQVLIENGFEVVQ